MPVTVDTVIRAIHQAAVNAYDGSADERLTEDPKIVNLRREEGDFMLDRRIIDGFNVKILGRTMILSYHSQFRIQEFHDPKRFADDLKGTFEDILKFLKKEFLEITGATLRLKQLCDEPKVFAWGNGLRREFTATCEYEIKNLKDTMNVKEDAEEDAVLDKVTRDFLKMGPSGNTAKNKTVTNKEEFKKTKN